MKWDGRGGVESMAVFVSQIAQHLPHRGAFVLRRLIAGHWYAGMPAATVASLHTGGVIGLMRHRSNQLVALAMQAQAAMKSVAIESWMVQRSPHDGPMAWLESQLNS